MNELGRGGISTTDARAGEPGFFDELRRELREIWQTLSYALATSRISLRNQLRLARQLELDYVVLPVGGPLPERSGPPRSFIQRQLPLPSEPLSMETLSYQLQAVIDASNVRGVVFVFQGFSAGLATLQNFRRTVQRLRQADRHTVVYTPYLDMAHYFAATAADRIVVPPSASFEVLGLRAEILFLKDALARLGIQADVVQISAYKDAFDFLNKSDITPEQREQIDWQLDGLYDLLTSAMADGRSMEQEDIKTHIDDAPLTSQEALDRGLVDDVAYEDMLGHLLYSDPPNGNAPEIETSREERESTSEDRHADSVGSKEEPRARLATWSQARPMLLERPRRPTTSYIGVVTVDGTIAMGPSRQPPVDIPLPIPVAGGSMAGETTITQLLRMAERDDRLAALILHVDSGGGSSLASDLIWRQVYRLSRKKPVVAYMGNVAASGGYYVCAPAHRILCQTATITGSIGVVTARLSTVGLYEKLEVNRVSLTRGERAMLYSDVSPLTPVERQILWENLIDTYEKFKKVVADGRDLPVEDLDSICEGRVWIGRQARDRKLVDDHGDFMAAVQCAAELADLPSEDLLRIPVVNLYPRTREYILPRPFVAAEEIAGWLSAERLRKFLGRPLLILPFEIRFG